MLWKTTLAVLVVVGVVGAAYFGGVTKGGLQNAIKSLNAGEHAPSAAKAKEAEFGTPVESRAPLSSGELDDRVTIMKNEQDAIGFQIEPVKKQVEPIRLELTGRTAYDDNTITKVRPRFDTRVESVYASVGQFIKKGDPLVELYSTDLAAAKTDFQNKYVQWQHDLKLYNLREKLVATGAISQQLWVDTQNDEQKSRNDFSIALDKLTVFYEVPKKEIDPLVERLNEKITDPRLLANVGNKAKMTLRAKSDGFVISRTVVVGNYYESTDTLMEIAPLDHLWVWVNVYELDQDKIRVGQVMKIQFPFLQETITGKVDYVANEVSKETRAVKIRAVIENKKTRIKADMLVRAIVEIPPVEGQTVIARKAMISSSGGEYVFVREPRDSKAGPIPSDKFRRIKIRVAEENTDEVVVASGLKAGQEVVTAGSLILAQLYEDQRMTTTGLPEK